MRLAANEVKSVDTDYLLAQKFYPNGGCDMYADFERVRPGLDRLEVVTYNAEDLAWYGTARAIDLDGNDVCLPYTTGQYANPAEVVAAFDALPPEFAYHNNDCTPGANP